jgi:guanylate kinase
MNTNIITITGPSGSGKTELIKALENRGQFARLISVTTRPMRPGEIDGVDYYFITPAEFQDYVETDQLVQSVSFNGFNYGTTVKELRRVVGLEKRPIVIVEPSGIPHFSDIAEKYGFNHVKIFITAGQEVLVERYLRRISEPADPARLRYHARRISAISDEVQWGNLYEYDLRLYNGGNDLKHIDKMAELTENLYGEGGNATQ